MMLPTHLRRFALPGAVFGLLLAASACDDDKKREDPAPINESRHVEIKFRHLGGDGQGFALNRTYTNAAGNQYQATVLRYYVSNVKLTRTNGIVWSAPASYHLLTVTTGNPSPKIEFENVPDGEYNRLTFSIGVDSVVNRTLDNSGDLDPNNDMYWGWATGYKFIKFEGTIQTGDSVLPTFQIHTGKNATYRVVSLALPTSLSVSNTTRPEIELQANANALLGGSNVINLGTVNYSLMGDMPEARRISDNAAAMYSVHHVHNNHQ